MHVPNWLSATILFIVLSPGLLLTLPALSKGVFMSGQTSITAVLVHAVIFGIIYQLYLNTCSAWEGFADDCGGKGPCPDEFTCINGNCIDNRPSGKAKPSMPMPSMATIPPGSPSMPSMPSGPSSMPSGSPSGSPSGFPSGSPSGNPLATPEVSNLMKQLIQNPELIKSAAAAMGSPSLTNMKPASIGSPPSAGSSSLNM